MSSSFPSGFRFAGITLATNGDAAFRQVHRRAGCGAQTPERQTRTLRQAERLVGGADGHRGRGYAVAASA